MPELTEGEKLLASLPSSRTQIVADLKRELVIETEGEIVNAVVQLRNDLTHARTLLTEYDATRAADVEQDQATADVARQYQEDAAESETRVKALSDALDAKSAELQRVLDEKRAEDDAAKGVPPTATPDVAPTGDKAPDAAPSAAPEGGSNAAPIE